MSEKGVTGISMIKYLKKIFSNFPEEITKSARGNTLSLQEKINFSKYGMEKKVRSSFLKSRHRFSTAV